MDSIPPHVRATDVVDFDYFDQPGLESDPHRLVEMLLSDRVPRIFYTPRNGGHWVIGGYEELCAAFRDPSTFSSTSTQIPAMDNEPRFLPFNTDPPEHSGYRAILSRVFSPGRVGRLEGKVRELAIELIEKVAPRGRSEFVTDIAEPLPIFIIMDMVGVPLDHFRSFRDCVHSFLSGREDRNQSLDFVTDELARLMEERRIDPKDDLISRLAREEIDGCPLTDDEILRLCQFVIFAGLDTVTNGMSFALRHLAIDPELQTYLQHNPGHIPLAVEELLRRYPFANQGRLLLRDIDFYGVKMKKGERALFLPPGAGLDPRAFPDPDRVILGRKDKGIPTFGFGPHRCAGMHLARLELRVLLQEWLARVPDFALATNEQPTFHGGVVFGLKRLALEWKT